MASLILGYEYDIFISYRQKDNKGDKWVSKFVDALKTELEATFKEDVSVYFDENPHDRLQETHNVDKSLEGKLKCLIFIPILSQTYCDPNSYAWQNEFLSFLKMAGNDRFGMDVRLRSGNVASRILPIRIHDLEQEDIKLFEKETGSVLRAMDFVFKTSTGVIRPLLQNEDHPNDNLNKTFYRDQISKVALAIKDIIAALGQHGQKSDVVQKEISKPAAIPRKNNKTKIIVGSVILLALIIIGYFYIPTLSKPKVQLEKSIAVLPFRNDSPNDSTTYFLNGVMEEILNNLQKISDFSRVLSRTSTEQYRGSTKTSLPEIAKKLNVNYIVEGSGQKYGNKFVLRVQLIVGNNEKHLWGKSYDREIRETSDIISIQSEIAQSIAAELKATITPEEKQRIKKTPTGNLTAYYFYQQGKEEYTKRSFQKAEDLYHKSLKYDSTFAQAYFGLGMVYLRKHNTEEYYSENYMDSVLILANIALSYDDQLSEAYFLRGRYYISVGKPEQAIAEFDKAIKFNPNNDMAYHDKGQTYWGSHDFVNTIYYLQKAISISRGPKLPQFLGEIGAAYSQVGFPDKAMHYYGEELRLDNDSLSYYSTLADDEFWRENFSKSIEIAEKVNAIDSTNDILRILGNNYEWLGEYKESLKYYRKWLEILKEHRWDIHNGTQRVWCAYWQNGYKEEADHNFNEEIKYYTKSIELKRWEGRHAKSYIELAGIFAFRGDKDKAYEILNILNQFQRVNIWIPMLLKTDPSFNSIRNEPEFQQIAKDIEAKYQAEHERVRKWMKEQGIQ